MLKLLGQNNYPFICPHPFSPDAGCPGKGMISGEADSEGADSWRPSADRTPHCWAASPSLKRDLNGTSLCLPEFTSCSAWTPSPCTLLHGPPPPWPRGSLFLRENLEAEISGLSHGPCCCSWSQGYSWSPFSSSSTTRSGFTSISATTSAGFGVLAGDVIQTLIARA